MGAPHRHVSRNPLYDHGSRALLQGVDPVRTRFIELGWGWLPVPTGLNPRALWRGAVFSLPLLGILLCHESGHYLAARRHKIPVSPPFFIPFPPWYSLVGTLGAFIRIRGPTVRRLELLDVAVAGPIASFLLSVPVLLLGLSLSKPVVGVANSETPFFVRFAGETVGLGDGPLLHAMSTLFLSLSARGGSGGAAPAGIRGMARAIRDRPQSDAAGAARRRAYPLLPMGTAEPGSGGTSVPPRPRPAGYALVGVVAVGGRCSSRQPGSSTPPAGAPSSGATRCEAPPHVLVRHPDIFPHLRSCSRVTLVGISESPGDQEISMVKPI